ncbi:hypothetical protein AJ78_04930 [Emergomyces pasteurianus Ep9510]|uniref:Zn(2)-C6 fungal-type domain-containing protein n=1 Tax=Emergomyces pasteurianus Ep9510 TaxID=1447872 RepID=A0A1J9QFN9_9EURO|nr:hypothetical protein AJ78_04930 [Emergomyces pasteurianus Ep9510]
MAREIYGSDALPPNFSLAPNLNVNASGLLEFDGYFDPLGSDMVFSLLEVCAPPDLQTLVPWGKYHDDGSETCASSCDDYEISVPHRPSSDTLASYDWQAVDVVVEQQGTQLNDTSQGPDVLQIAPEYVDEGTTQPTSTLPERTGELQQMTTKKSCWHCRFKHERCTGGTPCDRCKSIMERKGHYLYTVPCFREDLKELLRSFFPPTMARRIWPENWKSIYKDERQRVFPGTFTVKLTAGFGSTIFANGVRCDTQREDVKNSQRIGIVNGKPTVMSEKVLPILPVGKSQNFVMSIAAWVDQIVQCPKSLSDWVRVSQRNKIHGPVSSSVLGAICNYFRECRLNLAPSTWLEPLGNMEGQKDANGTLLLAMRLAVLATVLSTCINITPEGLRELQVIFQTEPAKLPQKWMMVPRFMNKMIKYAVCRNAIHSAHKALIGVDKLLCQKDDLPAGHIASIITLFSATISATQLSLVDVCRTTQGSENAVNYTQLEKEVSEMEDVLKKLRCLFHRRCKIETIRSDSRYNKLDNKTKNLVDSLSDTIPALRESTSHIRDLKFENMKHMDDLKLGNPVPEDIGLLNADRLFCALWAPMLSDNTRKRRRRS